MKRSYRVLAGIALVGSVSVAEARELSFQDRVKAQEAIERVYYAHRTGATRPFHEAVPSSRLEEKVVTYLRQSAALRKFWGRSISTEDLEREMARMSASSHMPTRLQEIHEALGYDPLLVAECLARPILADRMARRFYAWDKDLHRETRAEAQELRVDIASLGVDAFDGDPRRVETWIVRAEPGNKAHSNETTAAVRLASEDFARWRSSVPGIVGVPGPVREGRDALVVEVVLEEAPDRVRMASFAVKKRTWDDWWSEVSVGIPYDFVETLSGATDGRSVPAEGNATETMEATDAAPEARYFHTAVWTGTHMLVWGGSNGGVRLNTGGSYDPATDSWTATSTGTNVPSARSSHSAVWTGTAMIVWGGASSVVENTGGVYDPAADTWTPTSTVDAPSARILQTAVWTGSKMIVWGGGAGIYVPLDTGGQYDPETDTWVPTSMEGVPAAREWQVGVWTGSKMIVWGGLDSRLSEIDTGAEYDPIRDRWKQISTRRAPSARYAASAVWTGKEMIVWGGAAERAFKTGARYDPATRIWTRIERTAAPSGRAAHAAVWSGKEMIVWGGDANTKLNTGGRYDPVANTWMPTSTVDAPSARAEHTGIWSGSSMIVWGGANGQGGSFNTGGLYDPDTNTWVPTSTAPAQGE
jgi:N-acetylneuraminic acid mutarotase